MNREALKDLVVQEIEDHKEDLIRLVSDLIQIPSENPPGDSTRITEYIESYLAEHDLSSTRWNLQIKCSTLSLHSVGEQEGKELIFCGHTDVVPAGDLSKWDWNPNSGEVKDGWMLGRGASDMKAGLGGLLFAYTALKRLGISLPGKLTLAIVPDEETGGEYGVPWLLKNGHIQGDGCLIAEPSSRYNPTIGQKGAYWFRLDVFGEPGHGSLSPLAGGNAIRDMIRALEEIQGLWDVEVQVPEEVRDLIERSQRYMREVETDREGFQPILEHISVNIGTIKGGTKSNMIPESCTVEVDCRLPFGISQEQVTERITEKLDALDIRYEMNRFGFKSVANHTPAEDPVCRAIIDNITYVTNEEAYGVMQWASSDARHFRDHYIPVLQYGPAYLPSIHGYNEKVKVEDIVRCCKVYVAAVIDYLYSEE
ncbi:LOW QUALITY PROTEIN: acetylornithine deacetylase [Geomicrobium sp. JCM 19039]|nr:LOW QUALITY PROTEIN: acetylornithine deacetylase [Geomicrobium sp. JCM 19039]